MATDPHVMPTASIPELRSLHPESVRLAPNSRVPLPEPIRRAIDHPIFQRLRHVTQLGFVERVYPSASHTRFSHSIGVYSKTLQYVHALWEIPEIQVSFRSRHIRALLIAALYHDLGQYPYSHVLEDSERRKDGKLENSVFDHEKLTEKLLCNEDFRNEVGLAGQVRVEDILRQIGTSRDDVLSLLSGQPISDSEDFSIEMVSLLKSILNGPIDADKLDYLERDGYHTGVDYGRVDSHRFFQSLTIIPAELLPAGEKPQIALTLKGRVPAEQFIMGRLHMFTEVYWHGGVRAHEAVLATAVQRVRTLVHGFDEWFPKYIVRPGISDSWFHDLHRLASGEILPMRAPESEKDKRLAQSVRRLTDSLSVGESGRTAYTELLEISNQDRDLYEMLQKLRNWAIEHRQPLMDLLATQFAVNVSTQLSIQIEPLEIVFDIPPRRSPANTVFIVEDNPPKRRAARKLADIWPMWGSFVTDFHERMSVIRVFVPRELRQALSEKVKRNDLILYEALRKAAIEVSERVYYDLPLFSESLDDRQAQ